MTSLALPILEENLRVFVLSEAAEKNARAKELFFVAYIRKLSPRSEFLYFRDIKAFSKALAKSPQLIITDLTCKQIPVAQAVDRINKKSLTLPFLVAVSPDKEEEAIEAVHQGADDYVLEGSYERFEITINNLFTQSGIEREHSQTAERLSAHEESFRHLIEHVLDIITVTDINATILFESPSLERVLGYKPEEMIGKNAFSFIHPIDIALTMPVFMLAVATPGVPHAARFRFKHKDGSWRQLEAVGKTVRTPGEGIRLIVTSRDVSEKSQAEAALSQSHSRFRTVVEGLSEGLVLTDSNAAITYFNSRMSEMTGYQPQEMLGEPLFGKLIAFDDMPEWPPKKREQIETQIRRKDGSSFWTEILSTPFLDDQKLEGTISAFVDISDRKEFELQLQKEREEAIVAKEHAEQMNRLKTSFLANMSHEIRTPLTAIIGFASLLKESLAEMDGTTELISFAQTIQSGGERLLGTMSGLLDLASFESHPKDFRLAEVHLEVLLPAIAEQMRDTAEHKLLRYEIEIPEGRPVLVELDAHYMQEVLRHIIGNATKFTHSGHVLIRLFTEHSEAVIEIADTGIGISEAFLPQIFEAFMQESDGLGRHYEGNGLGLTLAKLMVDRMNGRMSATSVKGAGTSIFIHLPLAAAASAPILETLSPPEGAQNGT